MPLARDRRPLRMCGILSSSIVVLIGGRVTNHGWLVLVVAMARRMRRIGMLDAPIP